MQRGLQWGTERNYTENPVIRKSFLWMVISKLTPGGCIGLVKLGKKEEESRKGRKQNVQRPMIQKEKTNRPKKNHGIFRELHFCLEWLDTHDSIKFSQSILQATAVPCYQWEICSETPSRCLKPQIVLSPIYVLYIKYNLQIIYIYKLYIYYI